MSAMEFAWKESYSVGIELIDNQHKELISLFQQLSNAVHHQNSNEKLEQIFIELTKYANYHFQTEEKYFKLYKYPETLIHIKEHLDFSHELLVLYHDFKVNTAKSSSHLLLFLQNWLENHVLVADQEYGRFYKANGIVLDVE